LPCPTCGGTHAIVALVQGHWGKALVYNPLVVVLAVFFWLWSLWALCASLLPALRRQLELNSRERKAALLLGILMLALTWAWEIHRL
jgi:hypothetical protein